MKKIIYISLFPYFASQPVVDRKQVELNNDETPEDAAKKLAADYEVANGCYEGYIEYEIYDDLIPRRTSEESIKLIVDFWTGFFTKHVKMNVTGVGIVDELAIDGEKSLFDKKCENVTSEQVELFRKYLTEQLTFDSNKYTGTIKVKVDYHVQDGYLADACVAANIPVSIYWMGLFPFKTNTCLYDDNSIQFDNDGIFTTDKSYQNNRIYR